MSESKEFLGKTLDAAIAEACAYYDVPREKLEIDIIEDAKTGIFGIVGARKAKIRARLAKLPDFMQNPLQQEKPERQEGRRRGRGERRREKTESAEAAKEENRERREGAKEKRQDDEKEREFPAGENEFLPENCFFMMGDNRFNSLDMRHSYDVRLRPIDAGDRFSILYRSNLEPRWVHADEILGSAVFRFWPPARIGIPE